MLKLHNLTKDWFYFQRGKSPNFSVLNGDLDFSNEAGGGMFWMFCFCIFVGRAIGYDRLTFVLKFCRS